MAHPTLAHVVSHWNHLFEGLDQSTQDFYQLLEEALKAREIPDLTFGRTDIRQGGMLSAKRTYLRVWRKDHFFDICGAPFGQAFFVSWWLSEIPRGCLSKLLFVFDLIPVVGPILRGLLRPTTYYKIDTALMFQQSVHAAVLEVLDQITSTKATRALSDAERKPIMRDFFQR